MPFTILFLLLGMTLAGCVATSTAPDPGNLPADGLSAALIESGRPVPDTVIDGFAPLVLGASWEYAAIREYSGWDPVSSAWKQVTERFSIADHIDSAWNSADSALYRFNHTRTDSGIGATWDTTFICAVHGDSVYFPFALYSTQIPLFYPFASSSQAKGKSLRLKRLDGEDRYFLSEGRSVPGMVGQAILVNTIGMVSGDFDFIPSQAIEGSSHLALRLRSHNGRPIPP
jgi:hypothetical protein